MKSFFALAIAGAIGFTSIANAATYVVDDFDGGEDVRSSGMTSISPNNGSPNFSTSIFDVFGPTNRTVNFDFGDDSATGIGNPNEFAADTFGIVPFGGPNGKDATDFFFGEEDLDNGDNPGGTGSATWEFDISGLTDLVLNAVFSAMGDFEQGDNAHSFTWSIDGGAGGSGTLFSIDSDDSASHTYTMEGGASVNLNDPLTISDDLGTRVIDNTFSTVGEAAIGGTGSSLLITYTAAANNGGGEAFAFDDLTLTANVSAPVIPEPTMCLVFAGLIATRMIGRRRNG
ncbi:hypothetical protein Mal64_30600 [Pseudobythopirellula maris]|uniref:PEP-CTERM protein-sorting domain-containing protein n=1 Tax=Pseudobythopirellula maris TaxID=2527991 RepID=A0A5C5ZJI2_9BACT|nr:hypothetical protein [Pseudobythopirellula maris]TWT87519.1 hypothetical protein Mal64_30600 [Pseudobythopirellula maris]